LSQAGTVLSLSTLAVLTGALLERPDDSFVNASNETRVHSSLLRGPRRSDLAQTLKQHAREAVGRNGLLVAAALLAQRLAT